MNLYKYNSFLRSNIDTYKKKIKTFISIYQLKFFIIQK